MTKVVDYILYIDIFEQQCVMLKGMLQLPRLKYHMNTIGFDQSVNNEDSFEHKCFNNIKICINMLVSVITNKNLKMFLILLWFIL